MNDDQSRADIGDDRPQVDTSGDGQRLAVVVAETRAQTVIERLGDRGAYDDTRSVQPWDEDSVAVPVEHVPDDLAVRDVVRQVGEPRLRTLDDYLREAGWTDEELAAAPGSWAVIGSVVLVDVGDAPRPAEVGEALLQLHGGADTVLARGPITGQHREPSVEVIAGVGDTEMIHHEHGTAYALDLAEVMFSPGNEAERVRMGDIVETDERVIDMFAGIGYFTLPMARAGATVTAIERNPDSFRYLIENVRLNEVDDRVRPYRADCRDVTPELAADPVDRVVMGYYESHAYLDSALEALAPGGVVHMHEATPENLVFDRPISRLEAAASAADRSVDVLDTHRVKSTGEGVAHVAVDARIE
ncbi:class I SAM-dependent methyltransferase family protein [Halobacteriales archaeon QS_4_62_28]|nr:MAG: class I SAM-dependent methyltransferase family protein [Halobacteriales archaeon QS_4_62_28]